MVQTMAPVTTDAGGFAIVPVRLDLSGVELLSPATVSVAITGTTSRGDHSFALTQLDLKSPIRPTAPDIVDGTMQTDRSVVALGPPPTSARRCSALKYLL
jgi:hypothetical protein